MNKTFQLFIIALLLSACSKAQNNTNYLPHLVGGPCEGCEAILEYGNRVLNPVDTLPDFNDSGPMLKVTGTIYEQDGKTPAKDVILYIYHTNQDGIYATRGDERGWARRHGYIRGWVKTGNDGRYTFYTLKPGTYPSRSQPAHIHPIILEPDGKYYWLGSFFFEGDPLLTKNELEQESPRGGSPGVVTLQNEGDLLVAQRNFILGKNISDYE